MPGGPWGGSCWTMETVSYGRMGVTAAGPSQAGLFTCTLFSVQATKQPALCPVRELALVLASEL